jgi:hypothetical protein
MNDGGELTSIELIEELMRLLFFVRGCRQGIVYESTDARCRATVRCSIPISVFKSFRINLAEREGFEPSVQVLARTTV